MSIILLIKSNIFVRFYQFDVGTNTTLILMNTYSLNLVPIILYCGWYRYRSMCDLIYLYHILC